jgi:hypothetical protein
LDDFNVTAKDIRGFSANRWITKKLENIDVPETENERKRLFNKVAKSVSQKIGHGLATLKKHYLMPEISEYYIYDGVIVDVKDAGVFASGGELGQDSINKRLWRLIDKNENEITIKELTDLIGREPNYPYEYVGGYKLQKCFLRPFYKLV